MTPNSGSSSRPAASGGVPAAAASRPVFAAPGRAPGSAPVRMAPSARTAHSPVPGTESSPQSAGAPAPAATPGDLFVPSADPSNPSAGGRIVPEASIAPKEGHPAPLNAYLSEKGGGPGQPQQLVAATAAHAKPVTIYSDNTQAVWKTRRAARTWNVFVVIIIGLLVAAGLVYWVSHGSPTHPEDMPFIQTFVK